MEDIQPRVQLAKDLALRDTNTWTPFELPGQMLIADARKYVRGILHIRSTLDQAVQVQVRGILRQEEEGSDTREEQVSFDIGREVYVAAGNLNRQDARWPIPPRLMMPYLYVAVTAKVAPTTGRISAWVTLIWQLGGPDVWTI